MEGRGTGAQTPRVDFEKIKRNFEVLAAKAANIEDIRKFADLVAPLVEKEIGNHWHLLSDENYREGEFSSLLYYLKSCVEGHMPERLRYHVDITPDGILLFIPFAPGEEREKMN